MASFSTFFNRHSAATALLSANVALGALSMLSGAWLAYAQRPNAAAGLIGGAVMLAVGSYGLRATRRNLTSHPN